jgi:hypothetical protein
LIPRALPRIGLGLWGLSREGGPTDPQLLDAILFAHDRGLRLFDCSPSYAQGRAVAALFQAGRQRPNLQISLTIPCVGVEIGVSVESLTRHCDLLEQFRIVVLQPKDRNALEDLPQTARRVHCVAEGAAISISNLPPHIAALAAERVREVFSGELFIQLPSNSYTESVNCQFLESFRAANAHLIGYGLLLGGKNSPIGLGAYTYGKSVVPTDNAVLTEELSVDAAELRARSALSDGGCHTVLIGASKLSQIAVWADVLGRVSNDMPHQ